MVTPKSPAEWLPVLSKRLSERARVLAPIQAYLDGEAGLPDAPTSDRQSFQKWNRLAKTDFANLIVDAPAERMTVSGFRVGAELTDNDSARALWDRSEMDAASADIHRAMLGLGVAYGMASFDAEEGAVLTAESAFNCITDHDPVVPSRVRSALKMWVDETEDIQYAVVHVPGYLQTFTRAIGESWRVDGWQPLGDVQRSRVPVVPVVRFRNRDERGEFALHTDLLDRITAVTFDRLVIIKMQAYKQRAIKGELPTHDEEGNEIDYDAMFTPGPDALWTLPDGVDIWESTPGDISQILSAVKDDIRDLSAVTRTPMSVLSPDSANQSAEGAALMREGLVYKVEDRIKRVTPSWNRLVGVGLRLDGVDESVQVQWAPAERQSLSMRMDALTKADKLPWRDQMTDVLGYDAARVDQMEINRARDAEMAAALAPDPDVVLPDSGDTAA